MMLSVSGTNCTSPPILSCFTDVNFLPQSLGAEKDGLDIIQHDWALPKFEQRAEAVLRKLVK